MALKVGIVGLTNSGKTTLFNCISDTKAEATSYAFSTNKSNLGIANVADPRLDAIHQVIQAERKVPATIEIVDIPGLAKGAGQGEGLGNSFLNDIRNMDTLIYVLRCFDDPNLPHIEGSVDPLRDKEILDFELQLRDLDQINKKLQKVEKAIKAGDKAAKVQFDCLIRFRENLENFVNIRDLEWSEDDKTIVRELFLLTAKKALYVCNVDEKSAATGNDYSKKFMTEHPENSMFIAARAEADIAELDDEDEKKVFLEDMGLHEPGVFRLTQAAYKMLNLITFFTVGGKENRAWSILSGMSAQEAAGEIHSDIARGFIRAEVINYDDLMQHKSEQACKEAGKMRLEGKSYVVRDGDILHFRFNV